MQRPGLTVTVLWSDQDLHKLTFSAASDSFAGVTSLYVGIGRLKEVAESLSGFPTDTKDEREIQLGNFESKYAGGGVKLEFRGIDSKGHAEVHVEILDKEQNRPIQSADFRIPVEAAGIDVFIEGLNRIETREVQSATLPMSGVQCL